MSGTLTFQPSQDCRPLIAHSLQRWMLSACVACIAVWAGPAAAQDGKILFVFGGASVERDGTAVAAQRGAGVEAGDTLVTSLAGRMHTRMSDGALISLKPDTRFVIEDFAPPVRRASAAPLRRNAPPPATPLVEATDVSGGRALFGLLRGGFRTLTGLIGKTEQSSYRVRTPVATIGIRGTDYSVFHCVSDCAVPGATSFGVWEGTITVSNNVDSKEIGAGGFGIVRSLDAPIELLTSAPGLGLDTPPPTAELPPEEADPQDDGGDGVRRTSGRDGGPLSPPARRPIEPDLGDDRVDPDPGDAPARSLAMGVSPADDDSVFTTAINGDVVTVNDAGDLVEFVATPPDSAAGPTFRIGTAQNLDQGLDPSTGIRWGRWANGVASTADGSGNSAPLDLTDRSLHYIFGPDQDFSAIEFTGTASYALVGNTNPTDNQGNVGVLGTASLDANFTTQEVASQIGLSINNQVWNASGTGQISTGGSLFSGGYDNITINGQADDTAAGAFSGFFSNDSTADLPPLGAGLAYGLTDGDTTITGTAAFRDVDAMGVSNARGGVE